MYEAICSCSLPSIQESSLVICFEGYQQSLWPGPTVLPIAFTVLFLGAAVEMTERCYVPKSPEGMGL